MKRSHNVLPFRSENPSGLRLKLFATIFYLFLAFLLTFMLGLSLEGITALVILRVLYNFLIRNRLSHGTYLKDNLVILIILVVVFIIVFKLTMLLLLLLAGIYWLLVGKNEREAPYFLRFHLLTALILSFFILMPYLLLDATLNLLFHVIGLVGLGVLVAPVKAVTMTALPLICMGMIWASAVWLSISAIMGRTPYIPLVTGNVRSWA